MQKEKLKSQTIDYSYKPPIITVMGHVDHGKTTLLDFIRKSRVADKEFGGITQSIGGYQIEYNGKKITFIDTPGHEAFSAMRERGAIITDIIILVVAANDGVKDQTREVINLWKKTSTHLIVAINKMDVEGANPERVKRELLSEGVLIEGLGGDVPVVELSAKKGQNIDLLLETIDLVAEIHGLNKIPQLEAKPDYLSESIVIESHTDKRVGPIASVMVKYGTLKQGDYISAGGISGKARALLNDQNKTVNIAEISTPIGVIGIPSVLNVGEIVRSYPSEKIARENSKKSFNEIKLEGQKEFSDDLALIFTAPGSEVSDIKELKVMLKADKTGSLEAIEASLKKLVIPGVELKIFMRNTQALTRNDIEKAAFMKGIIIVFNMDIDNGLELLAKKSTVLLRSYKVIYELLDDLEDAMLSLVEPVEEEIITGIAEVKEVFVLSNKSIIAGCYVNKDKIQKGYKVYIERRGERITEAKITMLRKNKDEVKEVSVGSDCGILVEPQFDFQTGDKIFAFKIEKI